MLPGSSNAFDEPTADERYIVELMNTIRLDPLKYAESLGFNRKSLLKDLPWLGEAVSKGFTPLAENEFLFSRAAVENDVDDIGEGLSDPIPPQYDYLKTGETGGAVSFYDFMTAGTAVEIVVESLFKSELDPARTQPRYILSSDFDAAGASIKSGTLKASNQLAYFINMKFAASGVLKSDIQMLNVMNQIRSNPFKLQKYLTFPNETILVNFFNSFYALIKNYEPIFYNPILSVASTGVLNSENEELSALAYAPSIGYDGDAVKQLRVSTTYTNGEKRLPAALIVEAMLIQELGASSKISRMLLNEELNDWGGASDFNYYQNNTVYNRCVFNFGRGNQSADAKPKIYGVIFIDADKNTVYTPGEEMADKMISIYDENEVLAAQIISDAAGFWTAALSPGEYRIEVQTGIYLKQKILTLQKNTFVSLVY